MPKSDKTKILFLCTGNSCRSQMGEGFAKRLKGDIIDAYSAGVAPKGIDPRAVKAMKEVGIDIGNQGSKTVGNIKGVEFDYVITVCGHANETCPVFPGKTNVVHFGFDDPPHLAKGIDDEEEAMSHYRRVRDEIKAFVEKMPEILTEA